MKIDIDIREILEKLSLDALIDIEKIKNIRIDSRKRSIHIEELSAYEWSEEDLQKVVEIFKEDQKRSTKAVAIYLFKSSEIINLSSNQIKSKLIQHAVDFDKEEINGFRIIDTKNNIIDCEYWYTQKKVLLDDTGKIHYFRMPSQIKFKISYLDGILRIYTLNPGLALKCKKAIEETLDIRAIPISPLEVE